MNKALGCFLVLVFSLILWVAIIFGIVVVIGAIKS